MSVMSVNYAPKPDSWVIIDRETMHESDPETPDVDPSHLPTPASASSVHRLPQIAPPLARPLSTRDVRTLKPIRSLTPTNSESPLSTPHMFSLEDCEAGLENCFTAIMAFFSRIFGPPYRRTF